MCLHILEDILTLRRSSVTHAFITDKTLAAYSSSFTSPFTASRFPSRRTSLGNLCGRLEHCTYTRRSTTWYRTSRTARSFRSAQFDRMESKSKRHARERRRRLSGAGMGPAERRQWGDCKRRRCSRARRSARQGPDSELAMRLRSQQCELGSSKRPDKPRWRLARRVRWTWYLGRQALMMRFFQCMRRSMTFHAFSAWGWVWHRGIYEGYASVGVL